jgi:hypothetical protein
MEVMRNFFIAIVAVVAVCTGLFLYEHHMSASFLHGESSQTVTIGRHKVFVEVAGTPAARAKGLSGRAALAQDHGMLFILDAPERASFWMPDMHFPIDIIWIDASRNITEVTADVAADSYPQRYAPKAPARYVLEVNAGWASAHNVREGMAVEF